MKSLYPSPQNISSLGKGKRIFITLYCYARNSAGCLRNEMTDPAWEYGVGEFRAQRAAARVRHKGRNRHGQALRLVKRARRS